MNLETHRCPRRIALTVAGFSALLIAMTATVEAQSSGHKKIDKLIDRSQATISAIRATRLQIQRTLEGYNGIIDGKADDSRKAYKQLVKDIGGCRQAADGVRQKAAALEKTAASFFADWEASLTGFNSEEMRSKSEQRMNATRTSYEGILEAGRQAGDQFDPFIASLDDQVRFLGYDLNPSAIADLQDEAAKINEQAGELFAAVDETLKVARDYANSLEP